MKAFVYHVPGKCAWEDKLRPTIKEPGDATVRITTSTICGTVSIDIDRPSTPSIGKMMIALPPRPDDLKA